MAQISDGKSPVFLHKKIDPGDTVFIWAVWERELQDGQEIVSSGWDLPPNFTAENEIVNAANLFDCDGTKYSKANAILLSTTETSGQFEIKNTVDVSNGEVLVGTIQFELGAK